jgi:hypothetical protein
LAVLEGSVGKGANSVRITAQLIDASTGAQLWADRCDGALDDIFNVHNRVRVSVVGAISPRVEQAEIEHARGKPTAIIFLHGEAHERSRQADANDAKLVYHTIDLDPDFAPA